MAGLWCCRTGCSPSISGTIKTIPLKPDDDEINKQKHNVENSVVIWLNPTPTDMRDIEEKKEQLKQNFYAVLTYSDPDKCKEQIEKITKDKVFLILSGGVKKSFVSTAVNELSQIDSIYQFTLNRENNTDYTRDFREIHKPQNSLDELCNEIKNDIKICDQNSVGYACYDPPIANEKTQTKPKVDSSIHNQEPSKSTKEYDKNLSRQNSNKKKQPRLQVLMPEVNEISVNQKEVPFMYLQLFKEIILNFKDEHLQEVFDLIRTNYSKNEDEKKFLHELKTRYKEKEPPYWYTKDACLYRMLNKALRTFEYDTLCSLRVYIRHLHEHLVVEQKTTDRCDMTLFRGQAFDREAVDRNPPEVGQLITFANFLSTSSREDVAHKFAKAAAKKLNVTTFLIKIHVSKNNSIPFADISRYSEHDEAEYLFTIGSIFRILSIKIPTKEEKIGLMVLESVDIHDPQLIALQEHLKNYLEEDNCYMNLARLMYHLGKWEKSIYFYRLALEQEKDWQRKAAILNNLASTYMEQGQLDNALKQYEEVLELETQNQNEN